MSNQNVPDDMEFWIISLQKGNDEVYAKVSDFAKAGEKLIEANAEHTQVDYVLKPVRVED